jgi:Disulphide bond corrector protein DsbC
MLKKFIQAACLIISVKVNAQNPVHWTFTAEKVGENVYNVHCTATLDEGWHVYSQNQPKSAICQPTRIEWVANPFLNYTGKAKETGAVEHFSDPASGIKANQYRGKVDFVQTVKLKAAVKTDLSGKLTFQACTDEMCLPAKTVPFDLKLP